MPVIKTSSFKLFIINFKAHRFYKMKSCTCCCTGSCNITCILRNLRFN